MKNVVKIHPHSTDRLPFMNYYSDMRSVFGWESYKKKINKTFAIYNTWIQIINKLITLYTCIRILISTIS